jgi:hypothetical protein
MQSVTYRTSHDNAQLRIVLTILFLASLISLFCDRQFVSVLRIKSHDRDISHTRYAVVLPPIEATWPASPSQSRTTTTNT